MFRFLCRRKFSTYLAKYLGLQLLDCIVRSCLALQENTKLVLMWLWKSQSLNRVWLFVTPWTVDARLLCPWGSPGKNIRVCCHSLLHRIFPPRGWTWVSWIAGRFFTVWTTGKPTRWLWHSIYPQAMSENSCCSTSLAAFVSFSVLNFSHSFR